ncbi:carboxymuconolactone decarboxylase family protein [Sediminitomix flava]|uniref:AhpD family alkylhydroperoxidase n=1 Tax=Sediminitomix flava TaxID=379075 RepID=A0A315Z2T6_SEDFL|nr:carboxymuconolactone decarboxylase family protein [Sediminitomix flava]PWJ36106.1 AhpD family alkylhydroperoxidase [Sediminitomix flava]
MSQVKEFNEKRAELNEKIIAADNKILKRIFSLDTVAFKEGTALDVKTKEMIGLTTSLVLRCDDCVKYHLGKCKEVGFTFDEIVDGMAVANLIGGTIVIPHLRRAVSYLEELFEEEN